MSSSAGIQDVLRHLDALIGFDTQNPPRNMHAGSPLYEYLSAELGEGFEIDITDHGKGRVSFLAVRGNPSILFNVHIDTVPALEGSKHPPHKMTIDDGRVYGRGACDIKGAAACLLAVAQATDHPIALLLTSDEEGGEGCCVDRFIESGKAEAFDLVVVSEPTQCQVEVVHRGYLSVKMNFTGVSGHSSERRGLQQSAVHRMANWCAAALEEAQKADQEGLRTCFNIGTISGGVKSNIIADQGQMHWSARLLPGQSNEAFLKKMQDLPCAEHAEWSLPFTGPPLPTGDNEPLEADSFARITGLKIGKGLDFWTEASLFSAAGTPALVFGPGNIEQAHTVDEWVAMEQLEKALGCYLKMVETHA